MRRAIYRSGSIVLIMTMGVFLIAPMPLTFDPKARSIEVWAMDSAQRQETANPEAEAPAQRIPDSLEGNAEAIALGKGIFHTYCWGCHGRNGTGAQCPDFSDNRQ